MNNKKIAAFILLFVLLSIRVFSQDFSVGLKLIQNEKYNQANNYFAAFLKGDTKAQAYFYLGEICFLQEKNDSAKNLYSNGIQADKEFPLNYAGLAKVYIALKNNSEANKYQEQAIDEGDESNAQVYVVLADGYSKIKNYDKAVELLNEALKINPKQVSAYIALGNIYLTRGNGTDAIKNFQKAIDNDPGNPEAKTRKAKVYILINNFNEAISLLDEAVQGSPDYAPAYYELAELNYSLKDYAKAADYYSSYMKNSEPTLDMKRRYASILYLNKEYQKSIDILKDVIKAEPDNPVAVRMFAYSYFKINDINNSKSYFEKLFRLGLPVTEYLPTDYENYSDLLIQTGNDSLAIDILGKLYNKDTTRTDVLGKISVLCYQKRNWDCVVSTLEKKKDKTAQEYFDLGKAYYFQGDKAISLMLDTLKTLLKLEENQPTEVRTALMHYQADISNPDQKMQAESNFNAKMETILKKAPQKRQWASIKDQWWTQARTTVSDDYAQADTAFGTLSSKVPDLAIAYFWKARVKANFDPESEQGLAKPYYEKFLSVSNSDTSKFRKEVIEAYKYLGYYYFLKNDKQESLEYWRKVLDLDPNDEQAKAAIKDMTAENKPKK
ncbi:MAG TPA: tetratricopeptide repeat protein [Ignavibacteriaceae bacterium]|nr:tetratricopeptide repeat protein [Ignavibacteriaceae bacterium]